MEDPDFILLEMKELLYLMKTKLEHVSLDNSNGDELKSLQSTYALYIQYQKKLMHISKTFSSGLQLGYLQYFDGFHMIVHQLLSVSQKIEADEKIYVNNHVREHSNESVSRIQKLNDLQENMYKMKYELEYISQEYLYQQNVMLVIDNRDLDDKRLNELWNSLNKDAQTEYQNKRNYKIHLKKNKDRFEKTYPLILERNNLLTARVQEIENQIKRLESSLERVEAENDELFESSITLQTTLKLIKHVFYSSISERKWKDNNISFLFFEFAEEVNHMGNNLKNLMIRESYIELYNCILKILQNKSAVAVTGTPGIGKSIFAFFVIFMLLQVHKITNKLIYKLDQSSFLIEIVNSNISVCFNPPRSRYKDIEYGIVDPMNNNSEMGGQVLPFRKTIYCCSPKCIGTDFKKMSNFVILYMPPWSEEEIFGFEEINNKNMTLKETKAKFELIGGIPRRVFNDAKIDLYQQEIVRSISKLMWDEKLSVIDIQAAEYIEGLFFHIIPKNRFQNYALVPSSAFIRDQLKESFEKQNLVARTTVLKATSKVPECSGLRGILMEPFNHYQLVNGGKFPLKELNQDSSFGRTGQLTLIPSKIKEFNSMADIELIYPYVYYVSIAKHFPSVDALMLVPTILFNLETTNSSSANNTIYTLIGFQMTVKEEANHKSQCYGYESSGIDSILNLFLPKIKSPFDSVKFALVLVVGSNFGKATYQPIMSANKTIHGKRILSDDKFYGSFEQYAIQVPSDPT